MTPKMIELMHYYRKILIDELLLDYYKYHGNGD